MGTQVNEPIEERSWASNRPNARDAVMILLFNPRSARWKHRLPLSLLSLGSALEGKVEYEIVDGNFEVNAAETLARIIREKGVRYLGVTVMPGPQLVEAIAVCQKLKAEFPE